jgi:hypothetical protein
MLPVDREGLREIDSDSRLLLGFRRNARDCRRQLRLDLESIKVQFQRILNNAARPRNWASSDWRVIKKHLLEHPPEALEATDRVLAAEWELRKLVHWELFKIWLWSVSGFHRRQWGPVPNIHSLHIPDVLDAYERVRLAAVNLARCYGQAALSEEIAVSM